MIFYGVLTILAVAAGLVVIPTVVLTMVIERLERMAPAPEMNETPPLGRITAAAAAPYRGPGPASRAID